MSENSENSQLYNSYTAEELVAICKNLKQIRAIATLDEGQRADIDKTIRQLHAINPVAYDEHDTSENLQPYAVGMLATKEVFFYLGDDHGTIG